jgi:hypothetical protein
MFRRDTTPFCGAPNVLLGSVEGFLQEGDRSRAHPVQCGNLVEIFATQIVQGSHADGLEGASRRCANPGKSNRTVHTSTL